MNIADSLFRLSMDRSTCFEASEYVVRAKNVLIVLTATSEYGTFVTQATDSIESSCLNEIP